MFQYIENNSHTVISSKSEFIFWSSLFADVTKDRDISIVSAPEIGIRSISRAIDRQLIYYAPKSEMYAENIKKIFDFLKSRCHTAHSQKRFYQLVIKYQLNCMVVTK